MLAPGRRSGPTVGVGAVGLSGYLRFLLGSPDPDSFCLVALGPPDAPGGFCVVALGTHGASGDLLSLTLLTPCNNRGLFTFHGTCDVDAYPGHTRVT